MKQEFSTNYPRPLAWNYELLADYVDGLVDKATQTQIETALKSSEEAAMIVSGIRFYYREHGGDRDGLEVYLDDLAEQFRQKVIKPEAKIRKLDFSPKIMRLAAVVILLIASVPLIIWLARPAKLDANEFIAQQLSSPYSILGNKRDTTIISEQNLAYQAYREGNYTQAIEKLKKLQSTRKLTDYDEFVLGLSYLYDEDYTQAALILEEIVTKRNPRFEQQARWYLILAYFQTEEIEKSQKLIGEILKMPGHYQYEETSRLRVILDSQK